MKPILRHALATTALGLAAGACSTDAPEATAENLTSHSAVFLELSFTGRAVMAPSEDDAQLHKNVEAQLFYMSGELDKTHQAHGRFGFVELANVVRESFADGLELVHYDAKLSVAWPEGREVPDEYRIIVPLRVDEEGLDDFNHDYVHDCTPNGHSKYGVNNVWYDFRPVTSACPIENGDAIDVTAQVAPSPHVTTDRYPEQHRFWEQDGAMRIVLVHGTDGAGSVESTNDGLVSQYLGVQRALRERYPDAEEMRQDTTNSIYDDWTLHSRVPAYGGGEGDLYITTLLTRSLAHISNDFDDRFDDLTADADVVMYGGHSGLSTNIKAMAQKGVVTEGHYQVFLLQGCSTFAYLDRTITDRRVEVNGVDADPHGTKFLDVIVTGQPAYFYTNVPTIMATITHLADDEAHSYLDILDAIPQQAMPLVAGEEDNPNEAP
jgi:hypothetical protein